MFVDVDVLPLPLAEALVDPDASLCEEALASFSDSAVTIVGISAKGSSNGEGPVCCADNDDNPVGFGVTKGVLNGFFDMDFVLKIFGTSAGGEVR